MTDPLQRAIDQIFDDLDNLTAEQIEESWQVHTSGLSSNDVENSDPDSGGWGQVDPNDG